MGNNEMLEFLDLTGFPNLNVVRFDFLHNCPNIKKIIVTKEKEALFKKCIPEDLHEFIVVKG